MPHDKAPPVLPPILPLVPPIAIVTGAGSGIGRATACHLAQAGFTVALVGRNRDSLEQTLAEVQRVGQGLVVPADVSKLPDVNAMVQTVVDHFGRVDVLVNNAGCAPSVALAELTPEQWHDILDTNLSSVFYALRAVWPHMRRQSVSESLQARGVIINISSAAARDPFPGLGAYGAAKAAVNLLTLAAAREGREPAIRVVAIAPAAVDTPMFRNLMDDRPIPDDVMLHPDDVARMILDAVNGSLRHSSGDTLFIHRRPA